MTASARGRRTQLTKQIGEHLVAAELGRRNFIAAPFAGNVPLFDLLAASDTGHSVPVQVKASNGHSWHLNVDQHLRIEMEGLKQVVKEKTTLPNPRLVVVYVMLNGYGKDNFYILLLEDVQDIVHRHYQSRIRPRNPESKHFAMYPQWLKPFEGDWELLDREIGHLAPLNPKPQPVAERASLVAVNTPAADDAGAVEDNDATPVQLAQAIAADLPR